MRKVIFNCCLVSILLIGFAGCGEDSSTSSVSASLLIPRALIDDLKSVTIYLFETDRLEPNCDKLTTDFATYENTAFRKSTIEDFDPVEKKIAVIDDIPDRGDIWRFYARGIDMNDIAIAQGCNNQLYDIDPGAEVQLSITITPIL